MSLHSVLTSLILFTAAGFAATAINAMEDKGLVEFNLSSGVFDQDATDVQSGGSFELNGQSVGFGYSRPIAERSTLGLYIDYATETYNFGGASSFNALGESWDIERIGISVPFFSILDRQWVVRVSPSVEWAGETDADSSESLSYGLTAFAIRSFGEGRALGFGAGVFRDVDDEVDPFPIIAVDWRLTDHWQLSNPFEAGILGPAGLQLTFQNHDSWSLSFGAVYRSTLFRLDNQGRAPGGFAENSATIAFINLEKQFESGVALNLFVTRLMNGRLELFNQLDRQIARSDYDDTTLFALTVSFDF